MGILYIVDSLIKRKNVIMELQMLCELSDRIYRIFYVHFGYFLRWGYYRLYLLCNSYHQI